MARARPSAATRVLEEFAFPSADAGSGEGALADTGSVRS